MNTLNLIVCADGQIACLISVRGSEAEKLESNWTNVASLIIRYAERYNTQFDHITVRYEN